MSSTRITIRVKPGASQTRVGGSYGDALVVAVQARAVAGKATEAALGALAETLGMRRRDIRLVSGTTNRTKVVEVAGDDGIAARVAELQST